MYLLVRGTALEIQDKFAGKLPVEANKYEDDKVVEVQYKIDSVTSLGGLIRLSDEIYIQAVNAEVSDWEDSSDSDSTEA